jgi:hypothetical protein
MQGNMQKHDWNSKTFEKHAKGKRGGGHAWLWFFGIVIVCAGCFAAFTYGPPGVQQAGATIFEGAVGLAVWAIDGAKGLVRRAQGQSAEDLGFERLADSQQDNLYAVP